MAGGYPGQVPPPGGLPRSGTPPGGYPGRTTEGVLTTRRAVCLLRSRRRTFLLYILLHILLFRVVLLTMPGSFLLGTLASLAGLCIFAHFTNIGCDPLADGKISNPNQVNLDFIKFAISKNT